MLKNKIGKILLGIFMSMFLFITMDIEVKAAKDTYINYYYNDIARTVTSSVKLDTTFTKLQLECTNGGNDIKYLSFYNNSMKTYVLEKTISADHWANGKYNCNTKVYFSTTYTDGSSSGHWEDMGDYSFDLKPVDWSKVTKCGHVGRNSCGNGTNKTISGEYCYVNSTGYCVPKPKNDEPVDEPVDEPSGTRITYTVSFNENGGYGLECDSGWSVPSTGTCKKTGISSGTSVSVPKTSDKMFNMSNRSELLVGWTKSNCNNGNVVKSKSVKVTGNVEYKACYRENIGGNRYIGNGFLVSNVSTKYKCGDSIFIEYCIRESSGEYCFYEENGGLVKVYRNKLSDSKPNCGSSSSKDDEEVDEIDDEELEEELEECDNKEYSDRKGSKNYTVCYPSGKKESQIKNIVRENYKCAKGYEIDETSFIANSDEQCDKKNCVKTYSVSCVSTNPEEVKYKPSISVSSANIGSDGRTGNISVTASSNKGNIVQYYVSEVYKVPTDTTTGWIDVTGNTFTINKTPGIYYIWVRDVEGNISSGVGGAVFDAVNTSTTINTLVLKDTEGGLIKPDSGTAYKVKGITNSNYVRLSNNLVNESVLAENGFNPFAMEYKLEVKSPTISVYATLTSTDAKYVPGYEPRTVNLDYGMNTILIKIENNEGKTRTYTILVNRVDDRKADNTLRDLSVDTGKIDFNSNKTEYKIEIPAKTTKVNVSATIGSEEASFVEGFEPGIVNINGNTTVKLIKVKSQTGSTRTYVLTFVKEKTDIIEDKSLMLADLVIPGVHVAFEEEIANYNISVPYETELINIKYVLKDINSYAQAYIKTESDLAYREVSNLGIKLDVGLNSVEINVVNNYGEESVYRLTIIRKEFGLGISDDTTLNELRVLGYDISFEPNKKEYTVKIKQEKSLVITAIPNSNRAEVFIRGNDELTGFSTVRVKVVAENGKFDTYSIDIKKDAFNKTIEIAAIVVGVVIILGSSCIIVIKNKNKKRKEYFEE